MSSGCKAEDLLGSAAEKGRYVNVLCAERFEAYDSILLRFQPSCRGSGKNHTGGVGHVNGLEGFWSFAKERLMRHHGISGRYFPLYLKELEVRFNHRQQALFDQLCRFLCGFVPPSE